MPEPTIKAPTFASIYRHQVDEKRRLQVPYKWRVPEGGLELMLIVWPHSWEQEACIMAYPPSVVEKVVEKLNQATFTDPGADAMRRYIGARSDTSMVDKAGRISIPEMMMDKLKIKKNVVMVGMLDRFQIWTPEAYEKSESGVDALASNSWKSL